MELHNHRHSAVDETAQPSGSRQALTSLWTFMWAVTKPNDIGEVRALLEQIPDEDVRRDILSAAHLFREEGRHEGMRAIIEKLLTHRFQALPEQALKALKHASVIDLEHMAVHALTAESLTEILEVPRPVTRI